MSTEANRAFLEEFFAPPNQAWPGLDPDGPARTYLQPFLLALDARDERPLIVPFKAAVTEPATAYVVCWTAGHAARIRPLLEASVAHSWAPFDGRPARLREGLPAESSVIRMAGHGTTYRLVPAPQTHSPMWNALRRLIGSLETRPPRVRMTPRPIGRLLREFEAALSSGQTDTSAAILGEIERTGGVSLENLAFLSIRRFSRLGDDSALLEHPSIDDLVRSQPPHSIRDDILAAWSRATLGSPWSGSAEAIDSGLQELGRTRLPVGLLVDERESRPWSSDALGVVALVALARTSIELGASLLALGDDLLPELGTALTAMVGITTSQQITPESSETTSGKPQEVVVSGSGQAPSPVSWRHWLERLNAGDHTQLTPDLVNEWPAASDDDDVIAELVAHTPDRETDRLLALVGPFIDRDGFEVPAWRTAAALVERHLVAERLGPADLGSITALLEIALRGHPPADFYRELLEGIQGFAARWVSAAQPAPTLDMVDVVAAGPKPDSQAATAFGLTLLGPLHAQRRRLSLSMIGLADLICGDLALGWEWASPAPQVGGANASVEEAEWGGPATVFLYSLDTSVLSRVSDTLTKLNRLLRIHSSSAKSGSDRLRDQVRSSDVVVVATRAATHAATGFITQHMRADAIQVFPDGAGSASMLRAIERAVRTRAA